jgi:hypothetical protein
MGFSASQPVLLNATVYSRGPRCYIGSPDTCFLGILPVSLTDLSPGTWLAAPWQWAEAQAASKAIQGTHCLQPVQDIKEGACLRVVQNWAGMGVYSL